MKTVEANGIRFAYLEEGGGPLALLVHGFPDTAHTWDHVLPQLAAKGYRAVAPFTRGYFPTEVPACDPDARTLAADVLALIDALGGGAPATLIGHDWGASAAYGAAALAPEKVAKLITVAIPHPLSITPSLKMIWQVRHFFLYKLAGAPARFAKDDFAALDAIYRRWSPAWDFAPEELAAVRECFSHPESLDAAFGYYRQLSLRPPSFLKKKLPMDTVCFAGTDDPILTPAVYHGAKRWFTGGYTVEEMPGGHFLHREHPTRFAQLLLAHV